MISVSLKRPLMLPYNRTLNYHKDSEVHKHRYMTVIGGTQFTLYVFKWRTPDPKPASISVRIWDTSLIDNLYRQFSPLEKFQLHQKGLGEAEITELDKLLPVRREQDYSLSITSHLKYMEEKGQTVKYYPPVENPELGDPYIPKDILPHPHPQKLLIRVKWVMD